MKILLCGMGNRDRGDDGFGPYVLENIQETDIIKKIDCELYPENHLNKIVFSNSDLIIFFDTVKKENANAVLLKDEEIVENSPISITTHSLPFSSIYQYLKENSSAHIWFLGVHPHSYEHLSNETEIIADRIIKMFNLLDKQNDYNIISIYENLSATLR